MKKLLIIFYIIAVFWATYALSIESDILQSNIQGQDSAYIEGVMIGAFIFITTPLGLVFVYQQYTNRSQQEKHHAIH